MREIRVLGSAEGALGNRRLYSNITIPDRRVHDGPVLAFSFVGIRSQNLQILSDPAGARGHDARIIGRRAP